MSIIAKKLSHSLFDSFHIVVVLSNVQLLTINFIEFKGENLNFIFLQKMLTLHQKLQQIQY